MVSHQIGRVIVRGFNRFSPGSYLVIQFYNSVEEAEGMFIKSARRENWMG